MNKYFSGNFLSVDFWQNSRSKYKVVLKIYQKNCRAEMTLKAIGPAILLRIKLKRTQYKWCVQLGRRLDKRVVIANYVLMLIVNIISNCVKALISFKTMEFFVFYLENLPVDNVIFFQRQCNAYTKFCYLE